MVAETCNLSEGGEKKCNIFSRANLNGWYSIGEIPMAEIP